MNTKKTSPDLNKAQRLLRELRISFLIDMPDRLDEIESLVLNLEQDQRSSQTTGPVYDELYGNLHSIKGSAGTHGGPEERRVGKEGRTRGTENEHEQNNQQTI